MGVGDHQLRAVQAAGLRRPQERGPERAVLASAAGEPEDLSAAVGTDAGRHDDGLRGDAGAFAAMGVADAGRAVGGVEEHVRERRVGQGPIGERGDLSVQVHADPRHLGLGDPGNRAQGLDQVVDLAHARPGHVRLHDDREQRLVDPAAALKQAREERPRAQLRDRQLQVPGRGR